MTPTEDKIPQMLKGPKTDYTKFVVISSPRTGSNLLMSYLMDHKETVVYNELFNFDKPIFAQEALNDDDPGLKQLRDSEPERFLSELVFHPSPDQINAVGFKLMYNHDALHRPGLVWRLIQKDESIKIIHMKRRNILKAYFSLQRAYRTGQWQKYEPLLQRLMKKRDDFSIELPHRELYYYILDTQRYQMMYADFFRAHQVMDLYYEDLIGQTRKQQAQVLDFIGCSPKKLTSYHRKINTKPLRQAISNYDELKEQFRGTPWESYFDE